MYFGIWEVCMYNLARQWLYLSTEHSASLHLGIISDVTAQLAGKKLASTYLHTFWWRDYKFYVRTQPRDHSQGKNLDHLIQKISSMLTSSQATLSPTYVQEQIKQKRFCSYTVFLS